VSGASATPFARVPCPVCAGTRTTRWIEAPPSPDVRHRFAPDATIAIERCEACGLRFTNPRPADEDLASFYPEDYGPHLREAAPADAPSRRKVRASWAPRHAARGDLPPHGRDRLLDFGCGSGRYLARMRQRGFDVHGHDASEATVRALRDRLGIPATSGPFPPPELEGHGFDLVTAWQVLEHLPDPVATLDALRGVLAPGGKLVATVPNADAGAARWFGPAWYGLDLPRHLSHFDATTLRDTLARAGFAVEGLGTLRKSGWLHKSARRLIGAEADAARSGGESGVPSVAPPVAPSARRPRVPGARLAASRAASRWISAAFSRAGRGEALWVIAVASDRGSVQAPPPKTTTKTTREPRPEA